MHAHNKDESDSNNPYIQIMFNINSKKVVNNNILADRPKDIKFDLPPSSVGDKVDQVIEFPYKKHALDSRAKENKSMLSKINTSNLKGPLVTSDENFKGKKKAVKTNKNHLSGSETQRSGKNSIHKKNTS